MGGFGRAIHSDPRSSVTMVTGESMSESWRFYSQQTTDPIHNPISGEFFSTEAVGNVVEGLVREGIQNTLDARITRADGSREPARVRIFVSEQIGRAHV